MTRLLLGLSSLAPLVGIVAIRMIDVDAAWAISLGVIAILFAVSLPVVLIARRGAVERPFRIESVQDDSPQVPAYLLTYVFPFAFASVDGPATMWAYLVFSLLLLVLLARTNLGLVNPILLAAGFHTFAATTSSKRTITLISRSTPAANSSVVAHHIVGNAFAFPRLVDGEN